MGVATRWAVVLCIVLALSLGGCGAEGIASDNQYGELVVCDEVEILERGEGSAVRLLKAVYPGVEEGTATFTFCDVWSLNNGYPGDRGTGCSEGTRNAAPGFYRDGDLHVVCSVLDVSGNSSLETGAGRTYVRFDVP